MIALDEIRAGLEAGEFFLEYLPTIDLRDDRCVGAEALIRWRRPSGVVPPNDFIPLIENTHVAGQLTYWVIETAAAELGQWLRDEDVHLGINVPPEILGRGGLEYVVAKCGLVEVAHKLVLEITERSVPDKMGLDALVEAANRYRVRIALDDVNVSGANVIVLARCQVAIVKLDKELVAGLATGVETTWLSSITEMTKAARIEIIAEGVELPQQRDLLKNAGVTMAQGYFFSRPVPAPRFLEFYASRRRGS